MRRLLAFASALLLLGACSSPKVGSSLDPHMPVVATPGDPDAAPTAIRLTAVEIITGLERPNLVVAPPGDDRLFIVEQIGTIRVFADRILNPLPVLDIRDRVGSAGLEQGLLGLAFHPDFPADDRIFVYFTYADGNAQVMSFRVDAAGEFADPVTGVPLLLIDQPAPNHNAGMLVFGPDGFLYVGVGDGGLVDDVFGQGQRADSLLGSILRLDVNSDNLVPPSNPFAADNIDSSLDGFYRSQLSGEIWAYGARNPWRFDVDSATGDVYVADVGERDWEEISIIASSEGGVNLGWPILEGAECFSVDDCDSGGTLLPVLTYNHDYGCSITGGFVYHGSAIPDLDGHYFFSDFCGGFVASIRYDGPTQLRYFDWSRDIGFLGPIVSFGRDGAGELYLVGLGGTIWRLEAER